MSRQLRRIIATTDVHSAFDLAAAMLTHPNTAKADSLIVDCGDFFEGSGFYRFGRGRIEHEILTGLYDLLAPGNHGWPHYFEPGLHKITVCANVADGNGKPVFDRIRIKRIGGRRVAVTAVIGPQAFNTIPADQRAGHHVAELAQALREVMLEHHHRTDAWIVLSHSGFDEDLKLARRHLPVRGRHLLRPLPQPHLRPRAHRRRPRRQGPRARPRIRHRGARRQRLGRPRVHLPGLGRGSRGPRRGARQDRLRRTDADEPDRHRERALPQHPIGQTLGVAVATHAMLYAVTTWLGGFA
jgi:hypothetical protein